MNIIDKVLEKIVKEEKIKRMVIFALSALIMIPYWMKNIFKLDYVVMDLSLFIGITTSFLLAIALVYRATKIFFHKKKRH